MGIDTFNRWRDGIMRLTEQEGIFFFGSVDHATLATAYAQAGFLLYVNMGYI